MKYHCVSDLAEVADPAKEKKIAKTLNPFKINTNKIK